MLLETHPEARRLLGEGIVQLAQRILRPPPELSLADWAEKNRRLSPSSASEAGPYRLSRVPWLREIMDAFTDPAVREIVILKGARLGLTEGMVNIPIGYIIDQNPGPILSIWPTKEDAQEWSKETLPDLFESTVCLHGKLPDAGEKDSDATILHKKFSGGWLNMVGSNSARAMRRRNAKYVFIDEYDACDESKASKEGDIGIRAARRADTFSDAKIVKLGSPKLKATSRIWRDYLNSDQGRWHVPCPHCEKFQLFTWREHVQWDKEKDGRGRVVRHRTETAHFVCGSCGAVIEEEHKRWMEERGTFKPQNPGQPVRGFWIPSFHSLFPNATLATLASEWIRAQGENEMLMVFIQTVLAEPYEDRSEAPDKNTLIDRRESYAAEVPAGVGVLVAAVDIQDDRLELLIKGFGVAQESWDIEHHRIYGDPLADDRAVWKTLDRLLFRRFQHELGAQLTVRCTVVDMGDGDHTDAVRKYCQARRRLNVYAVKGEKARPGRPTVIRPGKGKGAARHFMIADARLKRIVLRRLRVQEAGPGYIHFPVAGTQGLDDEYLEQFQNEVERSVERKDGSLGYEFVKKGPNEAIDLQKMALAALHILGDGVLNYLPQLVVRVKAEGELRGGPRSVRARTLAAGDRPLDPVALLGRERRRRVRSRGIS